MADAVSPTEEQVKAANEAEMARWEDDFDQDSLEVKSKNEVEDAQGSDEEAEEEVESGEPADDEVVEQHNEPAPVITTEDPGEYKAADYSFEVTDKDGKTVKISTPEEAEKFADDDDNFTTARALKDFLSKAGKMETKLDRDYEKWETLKKTHNDQIATQQERDKTVQSLTAGFEYLIAKGFMPQIDPADAVADWNDAEVAKHAGVKEQIALINYMTKENAQREKAGIPILASALDAFNAWTLDTGRKQEAQDQRAAGQARRAAGARVASVSSSNQGTYIPKGIAVGRTLPLRGAANWED